MTLGLGRTAAGAGPGLGDHGGLFPLRRESWASSPPVPSWRLDRAGFPVRAAAGIFHPGGGRLRRSDGDDRGLALLAAHGDGPADAADGARQRRRAARRSRAPPNLQGLVGQDGPGQEQNAAQRGRFDRRPDHRRRQRGGAHRGRAAGPRDRGARQPRRGASASRRRNAPPDEPRTRWPGPSTPSVRTRSATRRLDNLS